MCQRKDRKFSQQSKYIFRTLFNYAWLLPLFSPTRMARKSVKNIIWVILQYTSIIQWSCLEYYLISAEQRWQTLRTSWPYTVIVTRIEIRKKKTSLLRLSNQWSISIPNSWWAPVSYRDFCWVSYMVLESFISFFCSNVNCSIAFCFFYTTENKATHSWCTPNQ